MHRNNIARSGGRASSARPRLTEVAELAGVSYQTVSRVLNDQPNVRPATRRRVLEAMEQLGYAPNSAARTLASGRSLTLGVVCYDTALYGPATALIGFEQAARAAGYSVNIVSVETLTQSAILDAATRLAQQGVSGIGIISPAVSIGDAFAHMPPHIPVVSLWGPADGAIPRVVVDEAHGARLATEHLLALGHRSVSIVVGPEGHIGPDVRMRSWRETLAAHAVSPPPVLHGDWSAQSGYAAGLALADDAEVSAVFVTSDQMALGVLAALHARGRRVPDDVSVVGFDDLPEAAFFIPALTTIRQDFNQIGRRAAGILLDAPQPPAQGKNAPLVVPVTLMHRASTAPPSKLR